MPLPLHKENAEVRLAAITGRKDKDLQHIALLGPRVADQAWEDVVVRAIHQLEIYDTHEEKTTELELALYLTIQGEIRQVGHQFLIKMDLWVIMDEGRRRMDGKGPRGPPGKKRPRYMDEKEPKTLIILQLKERTRREMEAQGYDDDYMLTSKGEEHLKKAAKASYYSNPAIPRGD